MEWKEIATPVFSGVPILMAADKPCPQLQPSLARAEWRMGNGVSRKDVFEIYRSLDRSITSVRQCIT